MRILYVIPYYKPAFVYGGPVRSVSALCEGMARAGAQVTVFTTNANGKERLDVPIGQLVDVEGVEVYYFRRDRGLLPFYSAGLGRACAERIREFDLVHSSASFTYPMGAANSACRQYNVPLIESPRGGLMPWDLHHKYWKKWLYLRLFECTRLNAAAAIHCTDEIEQQAIKRLGLRPPTVVVPNPIEFGEFSSLPVRGELRSQLGLPQSSVVTLFLSRISAKKGLDLAVRAFADVASTHPDAHFVIAGPDEDGCGRRALQLMHQLGLRNQVHFIGMVTGENRLSALVDADLFILTSYSENFGMAAAEALAVGLPVLLSDQVGIARRVAQVRAGAVVQLDVSHIAHVWSALLDNPSRLKEMGTRGRKLAQEEYHADAVARRMLNAYQQVLQDWQVRHFEKS